MVSGAPPPTPLQGPELSQSVIVLYLLVRVWMEICGGCWVNFPNMLLSNGVADLNNQVHHVKLFHG